MVCHARPACPVCRGAPAGPRCRSCSCCSVAADRSSRAAAGAREAPAAKSDTATSTRPRLISQTFRGPTHTAMTFPVARQSRSAGCDRGRDGRLAGDPDRFPAGHPEPWGRAPSCRKTHGAPLPENRPPWSRRRRPAILRQDPCVLLAAAAGDQHRPTALMSPSLVLEGIPRIATSGGQNTRFARNLPADRQVYRVGPDRTARRRARAAAAKDRWAAAQSGRVSEPRRGADSAAARASWRLVLRSETPLRRAAMGPIGLSRSMSEAAWCHGCGVQRPCSSRLRRHGRLPIGRQATNPSRFGRRAPNNNGSGSRQGPAKTRGSQSERDRSPTPNPAERFHSNCEQRQKGPTPGRLRRRRPRAVRREGNRPARRQAGLGGCRAGLGKPRRARQHADRKWYRGRDEPCGPPPAQIRT